GTDREGLGRDVGGADRAPAEVPVRHALQHPRRLGQRLAARDDLGEVIDRRPAVVTAGHQTAQPLGVGLVRRLETGDDRVELVTPANYDQLSSPEEGEGPVRPTTWAIRYGTLKRIPILRSAHFARNLPPSACRPVLFRMRDQSRFPPP